MSDSLPSWDYPKALRLAQQVIAEKGEEYVYPGSEIGDCKYFDEDRAPSCIVGHMLAADGISPAAFVGDNGEDLSLNGFYADALGISADGKTHEFLNTLQLRQDEGYTWGLALDVAVKAARQWDKHEQGEYISSPE